MYIRLYIHFHLCPSKQTGGEEDRIIQFYRHKSSFMFLRYIKVNTAATVFTDRRSTNQINVGDHCNKFLRPPICYSAEHVPLVRNSINIRYDSEAFTRNEFVEDVKRNVSENNGNSPEVVSPTFNYSFN